MKSIRQYRTVIILVFLFISYSGVSLSQEESCIPPILNDLYLHISARDIATGSGKSTTPGSVLEYSLEYGNLGNRAANNAVIHEEIPAGTSYVPDSLTMPPGAEAVFFPTETKPERFEIRFSDPLLPVDTFWWQGLVGDWFMNESTDLIVSPELFESVDDSPQGLDAMAFACSDLDEDGYRDVAAIYNYRFEELYFGYGNGKFEDATTLQLNDFKIDGRPIEGQMDISVADFNEDGHDDVVIVGPGVNEFYSGNGDGTMYGTRPFPSVHTEAYAGSVTSGDFNGDGHLDVVTGNWERKNEIFIGNGDGTFQRGMTEINDFGAQRTTDVAVGDVNNDGNLDLLFASDGNNELYLGYGSGVFDFGMIDQLNDNGAIRTNTVALIDLDGDNNLDVVSGNDGQDEIYFGRGDGTFKPARTDILNAHGTNNTTFIEAKDVNNDGLPDLLLGPGELYLNKGKGDFKSIVPLTYYGYSAGLCDFSGDGYLDIISIGGVHLNQSGACGKVEPLADTGSVTSGVIAPSSLYPDSGSFLGWDYLLVDDYIPVGTDITYDILDISGAPIPGFEWLAPDSNGLISLAGLSSSATEIRVRANLFEIGGSGATPALFQWELSFSMEDNQNSAITFRVRVDGATSLPQITNRARIDCISPDSDSSNNVDSVPMAVSHKLPDSPQPNYIELTVTPNSSGGYDFYPGDRIQLNWKAFPDLYSYTDVPSAIYLGAARQPVVEDTILTVPEIIASEALFVFDNRLGASPYRPEDIRATWTAIPFPVPGFGTGGSISFTVPEGVQGRWVFATAFVRQDGGGFPANPPVEISNGFNLR